MEYRNMMMKNEKESDMGVFNNESEYETVG